MRLKLTEKSYRADFLAILRSGLEGKNLQIIEEGSMPSPDGKAIQIPDIVIVKKESLAVKGDSANVRRGGIVAVVETKKPKREAGDGLVQAIEYARSLECKLCFTTNFRDIMGFKFGDSPEIGREAFGNESSLSTTTHCVNYIIDVLEQRRALTPTDKSDKEILAVLQGAVNEIEQYMNDVEPDLLKDPLGLAAPSLNPVEDKKPKKVQEQQRRLKEIAIKKGAAYLVVNQILFYNVLSASKKEFPRLSNVATTGELQRYFARVLAQDYRPVFGAEVAPLLPNRAVDAINNVINAIQYLRLEKLKQDILGKIFHNLIPFDIRKRLAAYFTSNSAAEFLASLSVDDANDVTIDFSCGSGTLLVAAYHAKKALSPHSKDPGSLHRKLLNEIYGVDVQLFASHLAAIHLSLQEPFIETDEVQITREDAFKLKPFQSAEFLGGASSQTKITLNGLNNEEFTMPKADLLIQNPPFTKADILEKPYKGFLEKVLRHRKRYVKSGMGLHCHFILHTTDFLKNGGRYSAVLPSATFSSKYGQGIQKFLLENYKVEYFITSDSKATFSEGSDFKEVLLVAKKGASENWNAKCIVLKKDITLQNFQQLADRIRSTKEDYTGNDFTLRMIPKDQFAKEWNWMTFTKSDVLTSVIEQIKQSRYLSKGEKVFVPKEGVHMNSPKFFFLPNEHWDIKDKTKTTLRIINKETQQVLSIALKFLGCSLRKPEFHTLITPLIEHYLVLIPPDESISEDVEEYIRWGENNNLHTGNWINTYCKKVGIPWYSYMYHDAKSRKSKGSIVIIMKSRLKRRSCLCHYFEEEVRGTNNYFFGTTGNQDYDKVLVAWFNSTVFLAILLFSRREISGDWGQFKIVDLKRYPCIDPTKLNEEKIKKICSQLDVMRHQQLPFIPEQLRNDPRKSLDMAILEALEIRNHKLLLDNIYYSVENEFATV